MTENTPNKLDNGLRTNFDLKEFNKKFNDNEEKIKQEYKINKNIVKNDEIIYDKLPHEKPIEDVIINIRELFYKIIDMLYDKKNPIPYIFASADRQFAFSILIIIIGILLLLFSNLLKTK
jgi:hypothetical protein